MVLNANRFGTVFRGHQHAIRDNNDHGRECGVPAARVAVGLVPDADLVEGANRHVESGRPNYSGCIAATACT
ncbi:hypothetical protein [Streptomyces sp. AP-93]|uniref:hypothetical protein n=1 Tax=Streptomyces sp. AP-93 TaxID=2929048 RepID=UPI001FAFED87|nr:hypothetical protein [Streptomyces sp. AP-93]MCJ0872607.1 hypothetical protein [Streptomyces sp. AP-93]